MLAFRLRNAGIDTRQWLALTLVMLKKDFRESSASSVLRHGKTGAHSFLALVFFYFLVGLIFVPIVLSTRDVFVSATVLTTYTMFMIGSLIMVEYHSVVVSPDDYPVLGYQPISSRTFFLVKAANILFYVLCFTLVLALPAIIAFNFAQHGGWLLCVSAFFSTLLANGATALAIILLYTLVLRRISPRRLQNLLSFFQVSLAFVVYSGFVVLPQLVESAVFHNINLSNSPWLVLLPSAWFSSYLMLAAGGFSGIHVLLTIVSLCVTLILAMFAFGKLSLSYSSSLAAMAGQADYTAKRQSRFAGLFFFFARAHEERVVAKLIKNQFLHDNKFKMAVLGILPLTIFYLFLGTQSGPLPNPFVTAEINVRGTGLLYLLVFLFPMMLRTYVTQSDAFQASWVFYTTPANIRRIVLAEKNFLMIFFVLPFLALLGLIFFHYFRDSLHVLLHVLTLGLLSHLFLQFAFLYSPDLPFSRPNVKGQRSRNFAMLLILVPFVVYLGLPLIFKYVYSDASSFLVFVVTILAVSVVLEKLIQVRVESHNRKLEFGG